MTTNADRNWTGKKKFNFVFLFLVNIIIFLKICFTDANIVRAETNDSGIQVLLNDNSRLLKNGQSVSTGFLAATQATNGTFGTCDWDIDDNGQLTIHAGTLATGQGNWINSVDLIKSVYVEPGVVGETDSNNLFANLVNAQTIDVSNLDVSNVKNFNSMFSFQVKKPSMPDTSNLTEIIGLNNWHTNKAIDMSNMFSNAYKLTAIDVSSFDTSNVVSLVKMFSMPQKTDVANSLQTIKGLENFDTSQVTSMASMFLNDAKVTSLNVSNFDTSQITSMNEMFKSAEAVTQLDVSNFDTSKVTDMSSMFSGTSKLTQLDVSNFNTESLIKMDNMFFNCNADISGLKNMDISKVTSLNGVFNASGLVNGDELVNWDTSNVTTTANMFNNCRSLVRLDISKWKKDNITDIGSMFKNCRVITQIDGLSDWDTSNVTNMNSTFYYTQIDSIPGISNWNTANVTNMASLFWGCSKLKTLDLSNWDTSKVTNMSYMFAYDFALDENGLKGLQNFNTSNVTNMSYMFSNKVGFKTLDLSSFDTSKVTNMNSMFSVNDNPIKIIGNFNTSQVKNMGSMFSETGNFDLSELNIADWDTSKVTAVNMLFMNSDMQNLDFVKNWDMSSVTNFGNTFNNSKVVKLDLSNWNTRKASSMDFFLNGTSQLWSITLGPNTVIKGNNTFTEHEQGSVIIDDDHPGYTAISPKWQEVSADNGGTEHKPLGDLYDSKEILNDYSVQGQPIKTFVWQQQEYRRMSLSVPDIDFGTIGGFEGVYQRKNNDPVTITKYSYPTTDVNYKLLVSMAHPLQTEDGNNTLPGTLIFRDDKGNDTSLENSVPIYTGTIGNETKNLIWDKKRGIMLRLDDKNVVNGNYSTTLNWELTDSL
ncbi:BspA family leucine-rich repeat surface protein [Companilactobacillus futsaii]|uniref:BspA family leucine-rich repeat surface protein n=1 Tax=Companilactobacillus futsaii TaxID=938155 RepID=UPI00189F5C94|nr:BspA family leucine-rich repeat surface protein [Companilactobacillus futsaii]